MSLDYGTQVSRTLQSEDRSFETVVWNRGKPPLDSELNLMSEVQNDHFRRANANLQSGLLNFRLAGFNELYKGTTELIFPSAFLGANEFIMQNFRAIVNGWVVDVIDSSVEGGNFTQDGWISLEMPLPSASGQRQDLVFLEVFRVIVRPNSLINKPAIDKVYKYGNTQYRGINPADELIDPAVAIETTQRVQLQCRIRIVAQVNFAGNPEGVDDPYVKARGPNSGDTAYSYTNMGTTLQDYGLYRAGNGDALSRSVLGTVDGYIYAIPLLGIHRRNITAYNVHTNPNGSSVSVGDGIKSDRPDHLFKDEINLKDIQDLRHLTLQDSGCFAELVESNFDQLLRGENQNTWGIDFSASSKGVKLLQVDAISSIDQPGIYDWIAPDGTRRAFTDRLIIQSIPRGFKASLNDNFSTAAFAFSYVTASKQISITPNLPNSVSLSPSSLLTWRTTGLPAVLGAPGWQVLAGTLTATLDATDPTYQVGGDLDLKFYIYFGSFGGVSGSGFMNVPNQVFQVFNENPALNERMGFSYREYEQRNVDIHELALAAYPIIGGNQDYAIDYNPEHYPLFNSFKGVLRLYVGHMTGNGTATYHFPSQIAGFFLAGFYRFFDYTIPGAPVQIDPSSVIRHSDGTFTVTFGSVYTTNQVIRYEANLKIKNLTIEKHSKGVTESYQIEQIIDTTADGFKFIFEVVSPSNIIVNIGAYQDLTTMRNYVYVNGIRTRIWAVLSGEGTRCVRVQFSSPPPAGATLIFEVLATYAPVVNDRIQIYYEFDPYQGLGIDIDGSKILKICEQALLHTVGTGGNPWTFNPFIVIPNQVQNTDIQIPAISPRLPITSFRVDSDLILDTITPFGSAFSLRMLYLADAIKQTQVLFNRTVSLPTYVGTTRPMEGLTLRVMSPIGPYFSIPTRGIRNAWAVDKNTGVLEPYFMAYQTATLQGSLPQNTQHVWWMLISVPPENELYLIILTSTLSGGVVSSFSSDYSRNDNSAYDVYRVKYRPLLSRRP